MAGNMASNWEQGIATVTQDQYCRKQVQLGVSPSVCAQRFADWQADVQGKGQKFVTRWQNGK